MSLFESPVHVIRESISVITQILSSKKIPVYQRGMTACVNYDSVTGEIKSVILPYLPDNASDELIFAVQGFLDHEVGHILFTDAKALMAIAHDSQLVMMQNVFEDPFVEKCMRGKFTGSSHNLSKLFEFFINTVVDKNYQKLIADGEVHPLKYFSVLAPAITRAWHDVYVFSEYMKKDDKWKVVQPVLDLFPADIADRTLAAESTSDNIKLAREVLMALEKGRASLSKPPKSSASEEEDEDDDDGSSSSSPSEPSEPSSPSSSKSKSGLVDEEGDPDEDDEPAPSDPDDDDELGEDESEDSEDDEKDTDDEHGTSEPKDDDDESEEEKSDGEGEVKFDETSEDDEDDTPKKPKSSSTEEEEDAEEDDDDEEIEEDSEPTPSDDEEGEDDDDGADDDSGGDSDGGTLPEEIEVGDMPELELSDLESSISDGISKLAVASLKESDYSVFTTDFDDVSRPEPNFGRYSESILADATKNMIKKVSDMASTIQSDLQRAFIAENKSYWQNAQRTGKINSSSLSRLFTGDVRVFRKRVEQRTQDYDVSIVIDCSGSMMNSSSGMSRIEAAMLSAYAIGSALDAIGVNFELIGFTSKSPKVKRAEVEEAVTKMGKGYSRTDALYMPVFKSFDENWTPDVWQRLAMFIVDSDPLNENADGECVMIAAKRLSTQPSAGKAMIVLSDGQPSCYGSYGGSSREQSMHLVRVVKEIMESGIKVFGIGIQSEAVRHYYPHHAVLSDISKLPTEVIGRISDVLLG